jgi:nucleoside phosphorylase
MTGIREKATASHHLKADILLVTVTSGEAQAVLRLFAEETGQAFQRHFIGNKTYFDLGTLRDARIMMVQAEMGAFGALLAVDDGIRALSPSAVIMVGIAFGVDDRTQSIGDILVSRQLLGYEVQKLAGRNDDQVENIL